MRGKLLQENKMRSFTSDSILESTHIYLIWSDSHRYPAGCSAPHTALQHRRVSAGLRRKLSESNPELLSQTNI
jgi:hypothetical protein